MKLNYKKLNVKLWGYFILFSVAIFTIIWLLQIVFLSNFYETMKKKEVIKIGEGIKKCYGEKDFENIVEKAAFKNSMLIFILDKEGTTIYSFDEHGFGNTNRAIPGNIIPINTQEIRQIRVHEEFFNKLKNNSESYVVEITKNERLGGQSLFYGTKLEDKYLFITTPIEAMNSATEILRTQLVHIIFISLFLSFGMSFFISKKISKPISNITKKAGELAKGNYNVEFENGHYAEIDELIETLNYTTKELSKVEKLRKDLVANVSHDLRTPLTLIKAYSEMIYEKTGENKEKREEQLKIIITETDRLTKLVNDILDLSKLESGNENIKLENINLSEIVEEVLLGFKPLCDKEKYIINKNIEKNLCIKGDKLRLEQVLYNLIGNGINHIGEDKTIEIKLKKENRVYFEIKDNGDGIAKEDIKHIWNRYYKTKNHKEKQSGGIGLGLSIVKNILELHKAEYGVDSKEGEGSTFWFKI